MKTTFTSLSMCVLAATLLGVGSPVRAGDAGHYVGGMMNTRDYFVPDPGFYGALYR